MLAIDEAKLPPPTPASAATISRVLNETPGFITIAAAIVGTSSSRALKIVQLRPPNRATANVYGIRRTEPTSAGAEVSRNLSAGLMPYFGVMKSTSTDQTVQTE